MKVNVMISQTILVSLIIALSIGCAANNTAESQMSEKPETSYNKPGAAVTISHDVKGQIDPNSNGHAVVTLRESYDAGMMTVDVTSDDGLEVFAVSSRADFPMDGTDAHVMDVYFTARKQGRHYLNIIASIDDGAGQSSSRAKSIAVQVGDPANNAKSDNNTNIQTTKEGERIVVMEAEETIVE